jgi:hypothetical protein
MRSSTLWAAHLRLYPGVVLFEGRDQYVVASPCNLSFGEGPNNPNC